MYKILKNDEMTETNNTRLQIYNTQLTTPIKKTDGCGF